MKFQVDRGKLEEKPARGIVYVLEMELDEGKVVKIGMTARSKVETRVSEILVEMWKRYRYFPRCYVARYKTWDDPLGVEARLHAWFADRSCEMEHCFTGFSEYFKVDVQEVKDVYDKLYAGELDEV
jgi:hypothetical protein